MDTKIEKIAISEISIVGERRPLVKKKVGIIAESMATIGLQTPITVHEGKKGPVLDTGLHRLEAAKLLGWKKIDCIVTASDKVHRKLWQDSENLHRANLTTLQRAEAIARWAIRTRDMTKDGQVARPFGGNQPKDQGIGKAAKKLGFSREAVRRAKAIASISDDAKEAAKELGLDNNQKALLAIAEEAMPEAQVAKARELAHRKRRPRAKRTTTAAKGEAGSMAAASDAGSMPGKAIALRSTKNHDAAACPDFPDLPAELDRRDPAVVLPHEEAIFQAFVTGWEKVPELIAIWDKAPRRVRERILREVLKVVD